MDYEGQKLAENIFYYVILVFGFIGWIIGYSKEDFTHVVQFWFVGVIIAAILCVPDWPFYNRNPIQWLESVPDRSSQIVSSSRTGNKNDNDNVKKSSNNKK